MARISKTKIVATLIADKAEETGKEIERRAYKDTTKNYTKLWDI